MKSPMTVTSTTHTAEDPLRQNIDMTVLVSRGLRDEAPIRDQLLGRAHFCEDRKEVKTPELLRSAEARIATLEAALDSIIEYWNGAPESAVDAAEEMRALAQKARSSS
jgi:hypothetical protein